LERHTHNTRAQTFSSPKSSLRSHFVATGRPVIEKLANSQLTMKKSTVVVVCWSGSIGPDLLFTTLVIVIIVVTGFRAGCVDNVSN
jgi:hypothetical protein